MFSLTYLLRTSPATLSANPELTASHLLVALAITFLRRHYRREE